LWIARRVTTNGYPNQQVNIDDEANNWMFISKEHNKELCHQLVSQFLQELGYEELSIIVIDPSLLLHQLSSQQQ